jgi:hypothetical protein
VHPGAQCGDQAQEGGAVNDEAVAAYRLSVQAGNPLSERKLARMFGRTSRRWARARITEARSVSGQAAAGARKYMFGLRMQQTVWGCRELGP